MDTIDDCAMLVGFDQQLDYVEQMLQKADKYNIRLVTEIDNLKNIVQANQKILHNLQSNEAHMKALLEDNQKADLHAKMISCAKRLKRKVSKPACIYVYNLQQNVDVSYITIKILG